MQGACMPSGMWMVCMWLLPCMDGIHVASLFHPHRPPSSSHTCACSMTSEILLTSAKQLRDRKAPLQCKYHVRLRPLAIKLMRALAGSEFAVGHSSVAGQGACLAVHGLQHMHA